jgi:hypothetical protein
LVAVEEVAFIMDLGRVPKVPDLDRAFFILMFFRANFSIASASTSFSVSPMASSSLSKLLFFFDLLTSSYLTFDPDPLEFDELLLFSFFSIKVYSPNANFPTIRFFAT